MNVREMINALETLARAHGDDCPVEISSQRTRADGDFYRWDVAFVAGGPLDIMPNGDRGPRRPIWLWQSKKSI